MVMAGGKGHYWGMLMLVVWAANLFVIASAATFAVIGNYMGIDFCLGMIFATAVYNLCHRVIYGRWL